MKRYRKSAVRKPAKRRFHALKATKRTAVHEGKRATFPSRLPSGFSETESGLAVPASITKPVHANVLKRGIQKAREEAARLLRGFADTLSEEYVVKQIEMTVSFSADGKFLGFGPGGAVSAKLIVAPVSKAEEEG
jgi:hypothetical protein